MGASKFTYAYDLSSVSGAAMIREFEIASATVIEFGEVVKLTEGKVVSAGTTGTEPVLGFAAEPHNGTTAPRETGTKILVYCSPTAVFKCKPNIVSTADSGNTTTWVDAEFATVANDVFNGGYLKLKSTTALTVTTIDGLIPITDFATTSGTFTGVLTGGVTAGDTAVALPPIGAYTFALNADSTNLDMKTGAKTALRVVDVDTVTEEVYVMARLHMFGNAPVATA